MIDLKSDEIRPAIIPAGIDSNYLIDPDYVRDRGWELCYIDDRLDFRQIGVLLGPGPAGISEIYGLFGGPSARRTIRLARTAECISEFFVEMVGGNVCVFDTPSNFLVSVLEGDVTLLGCSPALLKQVCSRPTMGHPGWVKALKDLRADMLATLLDKYGPA